MTAAAVVEDAARAADVVAAAAMDVAAPLEAAAAASDVLAVEVAAAADCAFTKQGKMCVHMSSPRKRYAPCRVLDEKDRISSKEQS